MKWCQKALIVWVFMGDQNPKIFKYFYISNRQKEFFLSSFPGFDMGIEIIHTVPQPP